MGTNIFSLVLVMLTLLFSCKVESAKTDKGDYPLTNDLLINIESRWKDYISLNNYLIPFWKTDTIHEEIVQIIEDNGIAEGRLLFKPIKVLSVKSADLKEIFYQDKDYFCQEGKIVLTTNSSIPFLSKEELVFNKEKSGWSMQGKVPGTFVLFNEGTFFRSKQISVTYILEKSERWRGPLPIFAAHELPNTLAKLKNKKRFKVLFFGDSIETGANCSGFQNQTPYMPSWPELIVYNLREIYGSQVNFRNKSVGGTTAQWGMENASKLVISENPDLVIIGFGMNDGTFEVPVEKYRQDITGIVNTVLSKKSEAEFIIVAPILANPLAIQSKIQGLYKAELDKLSRPGVVIADLTGVMKELLKYKNYQDLTGNNVNHPNDYMARWYAQYISGFLIESK